MRIQPEEASFSELVAAYLGVPPPKRMAEAGTSPPPNTRSNSAMPDIVRGGGSSASASDDSGTVRPRAGPVLLPGAANGASSTSVFHAPQPSQRPAHLEWVAPQD